MESDIYSSMREYVQGLPVLREEKSVLARGVTMLLKREAIVNTEQSHNKKAQQLLSPWCEQFVP
jgi:hypothetical protein